MSPALIGGAAGVFFGLVQFVALTKVADRLALDPKSAKHAGIFRAVAWIDLLVLPIVGYVVGAFVVPDGH